MIASLVVFSGYYFTYFWGLGGPWGKQPASETGFRQHSAERWFHPIMNIRIRNPKP